MGRQLEESPDKGWSWVIVIAGFFVSLVLPGISRTAGIFYVSFMEEFGVTREEASWPADLFVSVQNLSGLITGPLAQRFGVRPVSFIGSIIAATGMSCCYLTTSFRAITILFGVVFGMGFGLVSPLVPVIINQYFLNYRATASGIANSGSCFGSIILPLTFEYFLKNYGLSGCFLLTGGIVLHLSIASSFMRPPPWLQKANVFSTLKTKEDCSSRKSVLPDTNGSTSNRYYNGIRITGNKSSFLKNFKDFQKDLNSFKFSSRCEYLDNSVEAGNNILLPKLNIQSLNKILNSRSDISDIAEKQIGNSLNEKEKTYFEIRSEDNNAKNSSNASFDIATDKKSFKCEIKNERRTETILNSFRKVVTCRMFYVTALTNCSFFLLYLTYCVIVIDFSLDKGVLQKDTKYVLLAFGISDLVGRLSLGWITDRKYLRRSQYVMCCMALIGLLFFCFPSVNSYAHILIITSTYGFLVGCTLVVIPILLVDFLGIEIMPVAIGCMNFLNGIVTLMRPSLIGYFRDNIGSYSNIFYLLGCIALFASAMWLIENYFVKTQVTNKHYEPVKIVK